MPLNTGEIAPPTDEDFSDAVSDIHNFAQALPSVELDEHVEAILNHADRLNQDQISDLLVILNEHGVEGGGYGANFDMKAEVNEQIKAVKAMRQQVMTPSGRPKSGISARDLKEVATASNTMLQTLMKIHEKVVNAERMRAVEKATTDAIRQLPVETQELFFDTLEAELERIE